MNASPAVVGSPGGPPPLIPEIYLLWHPSCHLGEFLAKRIYAWLRPGNGLGPQVFYRSLPAPDSPVGGLPLPLPGEFRAQATSSPASKATNLQVVLMLIDAHMVADPAWRYWLGQLGFASSTARACLPIALDATAFKMAGTLRESNFVRPAGLSLPPVDGPAGDAGRALVARSLLRQLTEAMCRLLLAPSPTVGVAHVPRWDAATSKIKIFLSHAKIDGAGPARRVRDYIYSQTQLAAFFDENDIPIASAFPTSISTALQSADTAAFIAVRSASYAARPWCRRELSLFRRPIPETAGPGGMERWRLNPMLVVDALDPGSQSIGIPELGNAPLIRWQEDAPDQAEQIVTMLMRDVLLGAFHSSVGRVIASADDQIVINWLPDPTTLLQIPRIQANGSLKVVHPGRGLSGLELDILFDFFGDRLEFNCFEEMMS